ncbi:MAG: NAD(P)H-dependent oxidoreductase subunit E [bacterium]
MHSESLVDEIALDNEELSFVDKIVEEFGRGSESVIPILQAIQKHYRYLPKEALKRVCQITEITPAQITGVSTFYSQFRHRPVGKHIVSVCHGTACHVKGSGLVHDAIIRYLKIPENDDTDLERIFTVQKVACLGCCTLAPVVQIDEITYGHLTPDIVPDVFKDFLNAQSSLGLDKHHLSSRSVIDSKYGEIRLGLGSCCIARGSANVQKALQQIVAELNLRINVKRVGCVGMCHQTPLMEIVLPNGRSYLYARVQPEDVKAIILRHFKPKGILKRIYNIADRALENILTDRAWEPVERYSIEIRDPQVNAFLHKQKHIATEYSGIINPTALDEYIDHDGFKALNLCLNELSSEEVIEEIRKSGLRGRGGAGFPTGVKWSIVRQAKGDVKYIICNGDEGDPGAFMDRMLLESYPYRILEGMIIAAYAVGINEGYLYIRAEYPLALQRIREAIHTCEECGYLGNNILGSNFSLHLKIMEGAGAFVCGEETALIESIEGRRGMPRLRPPYPAIEGLWGKPTLINNVETYALVPWIIRNRADVFASLGTEDSKGTKVFALAGKVARGGLIEVPMGITIREIVEEIGGGVGNGRRFKAVQIGGPSGGCIPAELSYTPVDYHALTSLGAIMGSGGLVVLDDTDCMVEIARYFLEFTQDQSCGKCTYCRIGTRRMLEILTRICIGQGEKSDLKELERLATIVSKASLCGLGKTAPNPVLTTLKYFRNEYEAHLEGRCPAGKCKQLIKYVITDDCIGCTICAQHCPVDAIKMTPYEKHIIDDEKCTRCNTCKLVCPENAVIIKSRND